MPAPPHPYFANGFAALAHRGGWIAQADADRENSLFAFKQAVAAGFRYLELDVRATADGELLVFHDADLDRATDGTGRISQQSWSELASVRIAGKDPIPRLAELLEALPTARLNIDLKDAAGVPLLADLLERHAAVERVCVASFSGARLTAIRRRLPQVATSTSPAGVAWASLARGLRRWWPEPGQVVQLPIRYPGVPFALVRPDVIRAAHAAGRLVHVWTVNDAALMHRLIDLGVDGLVSDDLSTLKSVLLDRELWVEA